MVGPTFLGLCKSAHNNHKICWQSLQKTIIAAVTTSNFSTADRRSPVKLDPLFSLISLVIRLGMTASVFQPTPDEQGLLRILSQQLDQLEPGASLEVTFPGQKQPVSISPVLVEVLRTSLKEFSEGHGVTLLTHKRELSTHEAADLLGVSRPHLISQLLEGGLLPYHRVGTHRRLSLIDVQRYQEERKRQHALLDEIAADEQASGLY
jgi:excisionase family DNA binding protein